ncbi:hypothetical protein [Streptomyces fradiae]|uniref:hypothetical protein n=1 Tax=Streptomyces fradiae TaxID=1906 RepID=UPI00364D6CB6
MPPTPDSLSPCAPPVANGPLAAAGLVPRVAGRVLLVAALSSGGVLSAAGAGAVRRLLGMPLPGMRPGGGMPGCGPALGRGR